MRPDDLLDHALGLLEGHPLAVLEAELSRDPEAQVRADRLALALARLLDDDDDAHEPPPGLADRTVAFVADQASTAGARRMILDFVPKRVPFRWTDVAVAAGIFGAGILTLLPAAKSGRERMNQAACAYNLRELGINLTNYAHRHNHYPKVCDVGTSVPVGSYAVALQKESLLPDAKTLHCPCNGDCSPEAISTNPRHMDFAYNVGYVDSGSGRPVPISPLIGEVVPLLADQPAHDGKGVVLPGNSPNHGGRGQNVLYTDLHLRWLPGRLVGPRDSDLFLNEHRQPGPGVSIQDAAVIPAAFRVEVPR